MKRAIAILICLAWSNALGQPEAYVINNLAETLSRINLETGQVQNHVVTLGETPNHIALHEGNIYVLNSISANLQKIDPASFQIVADIPLPVGSNPYAAAFDGGAAYVSGLVSGKVYRINLTSGQVDSEITIGGYPEGMVVFEGRLYITQTGFNPDDFTYGQGQMAVVSLGDFSLQREVNVGKNPQAIILTPNGRLHIVCTGNYVDIAGSLYIYNPLTSALEDSILIGGQPSSAVVSRQGMVYLGAGGWVDHGYIYAYNSYSLEILNGPANPIQTGLGAYSVAVDSLGFLYSCDFGGDTVTKLSGAGQFVARFGLGDGPQSIVISDTRTSSLEDDGERLPSLSGFLRNYPNPFNSGTVIEYEIQNYTGPVSLEIFDMGGRLVNVLNSGTTGYTSAVNTAGAVTWDGRDISGKTVSSGLYFARLKIETGYQPTGEVWKTLKLSLIK